MIGKNTILIWIIIQIVPLSVLYFIYNYFSEQNFFNISGAWKGVVASGPIAAYIFLTWLGFKYLKQLVSMTFKLNEEVDSIVGNWHFESASASKRAAKGSCEITNKNNLLKISGNYEEEDEIATLWESDIAFLDGSNLFYVYKLDSHNVGYIGYARLRISKRTAKKATEMKGEWIAIGQEKKRGNITLARP